MVMTPAVPVGMVDVENYSITGYMCFCSLKGGVPLIKWISRQRNSQILMRRRQREQLLMRKRRIIGERLLMSQMRQETMVRNIWYILIGLGCIFPLLSQPSSNIDYRNYGN